MQMRKEFRFCTYADYVTWPDDERWELIDGVPYAMAAAPSRKHQEIGGEIFRQIANYLLGKTCNVYSAPFDVRLNADEADDTVVQPDITIVCDAKKLDDKGCKGVPDMVVEVISPSTAKYDMFKKFNRYLMAGIGEFWLVDPEEKTVVVHLLKEGEYVTRVYDEAESIPVALFEGFSIDMKTVFPAPQEEPQPPVSS